MGGRKKEGRMEGGKEGREEKSEKEGTSRGRRERRRKVLGGKRASESKEKGEERRGKEMTPNPTVDSYDRGSRWRKKGGVLEGEDHN